MKFNRFEKQPTKYLGIQSLRGAAGVLKQPMEWKEAKKIAHEDRLENKYGQ